jgi:hypothetical protein
MFHGRSGLCLHPFRPGEPRKTMRILMGKTVLTRRIFLNDFLMELRRQRRFNSSEFFVGKLTLGMQIPEF